MKCDNCKNKDICKHVEYMQSVEDKVKDLGLDNTISIRVDIKCGYMQENVNGQFIPREWYEKPRDICYPRITYDSSSRSM